MFAGGDSLLVGTLRFGDTAGPPGAAVGLGGAARNGLGGEFGSAGGELDGSDG